MICNGKHPAGATDETVVMVDAGSEEMRCRPGFSSRLKYMDGNPSRRSAGTPSFHGQHKDPMINPRTQ